MPTAARALISRSCLAATLAIVACGDSSSDPDAVPEPSQQIAAVGATTTTAEAGTTLASALRVRVVRGGAPVPGVAITWVSVGGGSVTPSASTTDAAGEATASWIVGNAVGTVRARATATGSTGTVEFTATVRAGPPASLTGLGPATIAGVSGSTVVDGVRVQLRDAFANPVRNAAVTWDVTGSATTATSTATTDPTGIARTSVTLPQAGMSTVRASTTGAPALQTAFTITALAAASAEHEVIVVNNAFQPGTITVPVNALVRWRWQGTSGVAHFVVSSAEPSFGSPMSALSGDGVRFQFVFAVPGTYRYECSLHSGMTGVVVVQ